MNAGDVIKTFYAEAEYPLGWVGVAEKWLRDDCVFVQNGNPNCANKKEILDLFDSYNYMYRRPWSRVELRRLIVDGDTVITERTENNYSREADNVFTGHFASIFRVDENDKIFFWHDYFDQGEYKFGRAQYIPNVDEMAEYRAKLGFAPRDFSENYDIVSAYNM